jgi:hypothetical protein
VTLLPGRHTAVLELRGDRIAHVAITGLTPGASICVTGVSVVRPLFREAGHCFGMNVYGMRQRRPIACPDHWFSS